MCRFCDPRVKFQHWEQRELTYCMVAWDVSLRVLVQDGKKCFNMLGRFPLPLDQGFQRNRVCGIKVTVARLPELRQAHVSDGAKSAAGRPFLRIDVSASVHAEVWSLCR